MLGYDDSARPDSLPGYDTNSALPGSGSGDLTPAAPDMDPDVIDTDVDGPQYRSALSDTAAMPAAMMAALQTSVVTADAQAQQAANAQPGAPTGFDPLAGSAQPGQPPPRPPPVPNAAHPQQMSGYIAASLDWADDSLIGALQAAASGGGPQAALMAPTVQVDALRGIAKAGGAIPVGRHSAPASALIYGSQGGQAQFARNSPWFFPAVQAWAVANPIPQVGPPPDGTVPMEGA